MATYKGIKGVKVQSKASDPTASEAEGTVWYNTPADALKYAIAGAGAWASGTAINTARAGGASGGTQTAAFFAGGAKYPPAPVHLAVMEVWNGSTWTEVGNLTTSRQYVGGDGTSTAAIAAGGRAPPPPSALGVTEKWNGSSWTEVGNLLTSRYSDPVFGISTLAVCAGGASPATGVVEEWDGTSWSEVNNLGTARYASARGGTLAAGIIAGGDPQTGKTETYDGTSWAEVNALNDTRYGVDGCSGDSNTTAIVFGGVAPGYTTNTETYDGTSWAEVANMGTGFAYRGSAGTKTAAIAIGGVTTGSSYLTNVEEWNEPVYTIKTVTVS